MSDRLEKFIQSHRQKFDRYDVPPGNWDKITTAMDKKNEKPGKVRSMMLFVSGMAASLLIGAVAIFGYQMYYQQQADNELVSSPTVEEYQELEEYYIQEVNNKMNNLEQYDLDPSVESDLSQLDAIYHELKRELVESNNMNNHEIIEALIKNYKTKIELLEIIKHKQTESKNKEKDETTNI